MGRAKRQRRLFSTRNRLACGLLAAFLSLGAISQAQEAAQPVEPTPLPQVEFPSREKVASEIETLEKAADGDPDLKSKLLEIHKGLLQQFDRIDESKKLRENQQAQLTEAEQRRPELEQKLAQPAGAATAEIGESSTVSQLERRVAELEAELEVARRSVSALEEELANLGDRRKQLPELLANAKQILEGARSERRTPLPADIDPAVAEAQRVFLAAKEIAAEGEVQALEQELPFSEVRSPYLTLSRDWAIRRLADLQQRIDLFRTRLSETRQREAAEAAAKAREEAEALVPGATEEPEFRELIGRLAAENAKIAEFRNSEEGPVRGAEKTVAAADQVNKLLEQVRKDFHEVQDRVEIAGLDDSLGDLLRRHRSELPNYREHQRKVRDRQVLLAQVQLKEMDLSNERDALANLDAVARADLSQIPPAASSEIQIEREKTVRELHKTRRDYLDTLLNDYGGYYQKLKDLDNKERDLVEEARAFAEFVNENILWIPSGTAFSPSTLREALAGVRWLFDVEGWLGVAGSLVADIGSSPLAAGLGWIAVCLFFLARPRLREQIRMAGVQAQRPLCVSILPTFKALFFTLLLSATAPAVLGFAGWRLVSFVGPDFARSIGFGAQISALVYLAIEIFRQTLRPEGLAIIHFGWSEKSLPDLRRNLTWLLALTVPVLLVYTALQWYLGENYQESFGRLLFIANMIALVVFARRSLRPPAGSFGKVFDSVKSTEGVRIRVFWYALCTGAPLLILALAFFGYYYTAFRLGARLFATLAFTLAATILYSLLLRWLLLAKRRIKLDQLRKKREAAQSEDSSTPKPEAELEQEVDLERIDLQTRRLLRSCVAFVFIVGLWYIWEQELPAFSILGEWTVWEIESTTTVKDPEGFERQEITKDPITLAHLALAFLVGALTVAAMRNLPGLLEIALLQRLQLGQGERYALTSIARYVILIFGVIFTFKSVGVGWSKVQWLVAAVSLGLGFGMQEIFANFVSGVMLLFERPIRVGDTVTVSGISGQVSKINIRATTIVDFDRKELIVPNKQFVTGHLVNWTLSDTVIRQIVKVGIAYGADTDLVERILYRVAKDEPLILDDPGPRVVFYSFGEKALDFELRVFVKDVNDYALVRHRLHQAIYHALREASVETILTPKDPQAKSPDDLSAPKS